MMTAISNAGLLNYGVVVDVACLQIYYTSDIVKI